MQPKYLFFHTTRAAIFQLYAFVALLFTLFYINLTFAIPQAALVGGTIFYIAVVVCYAFHIDRAGRGNRGL
jgi:uncharacterized membrane protein